MNACIDTLSVYRTSVANQPQSSGLIAPHSLRLLPLFILAIMKHVSMTLYEPQEIIGLCFGLAFHSLMCSNHANPAIFFLSRPSSALFAPFTPFFAFNMFQSEPVDRQNY